MVTSMNGSWTVGLMNREGRRHRVGFPDRPTAQAYERYIKCRSREKRRLKHVLRRACHAIWHGSRNERNCVTNTEEIIHFFGPDSLPSAITTASVGEFVVYLRDFRRNRPGTINRKLATLRQLAKFLCDEDLLVRLPSMRRQREDEGRIRFLTSSEERRLFAHLKGKRGAHAAFARFLLYTGARVGEARCLTWEDVGPDRVTFWSGKSRRPRTIPLVKQARSAVSLVRRLGWSEPFANINPAGFRSAWLKALQKASLGSDRRLVPHILRHTCASRLVQGGVDLVRVKEWLGHSSITITMRYAHLAPNDLFEAAGVLERSGVPVRHSCS